MSIKAPSRHERCKELIELLLADGPRAAGPIYQTLFAAGYTKGTIYRAASQLGVISTRDASWHATTVWEIKNNA